MRNKENGLLLQRILRHQLHKTAAPLRCCWFDQERVEIVEIHFLWRERRTISRRRSAPALLLTMRSYMLPHRQQLPRCDAAAFCLADFASERGLRSLIDRVLRPAILRRFCPEPKASFPSSSFVCAVCDNNAASPLTYIWKFEFPQSIKLLLLLCDKLLRLSKLCKHLLQRFLFHLDCCLLVWILRIRWLGQNHPQSINRFLGRPDQVLRHLVSRRHLSLSEHDRMSCY